MIIGEFNDAYPPELDGVGTVVKSYAQILSQMGDDCYYIAPNDPNYESDHSFKTLLYRGIKMPGEPYHVGLPGLDFRYLSESNRIRFDIVHAHSPFVAGMEALRLAKKLRLPIVATFHSKYYDDFYGKTHSDLLASLGTNFVVDFYNKCDEVWAVNEKTAEVLAEYGYKREIVVMPNGTNIFMPEPEDVRAAEERLHLGSESTFLFVGQMNWKKNIKKTLEAVAIYGRKHPFRLLMVGQGPNEKEIREYAETLGLTGRIEFTGHIKDRRLLLAIFARSDLLIFPSIYDNAPMVVREAASVRTPAILIRGSCAAEGVEDGVNGLLCEDDSQSIAEAIERGLPIKDRLGEQAQKTIPIPWQPIIEKVRARYLDLIERKQRG